MSRTPPADAALERQLDHVALLSVYARLPLSLAFTLGTSIIFGLLFLPFFPREGMFVWVGVIQLTGLARLALWHAHRRAQPGIDATATWSRRFLVGSLAAAVSWSFGALALRPADGQVEIAALCVALLGVSAIAASSMSGHLPSLIAFLLGCLAPFAGTLLLEDAPIERLVGALLLTGLVAFAWVGWQSSRTLRQLLRTELGLQAAIDDSRRMQQAAEKASVAKSRFLATMSHEVRTPLNGILGLTDMLESSALDPRQRRHLRLLRQSGEHLRGIVDDVLDFSKIEAGQMELLREPFEPRRLVEELLELWLPRARAAGLELRLAAPGEVPLRVEGDPLRLRQVLNNFVGNALKFTAQGGVELSLAAEERGPYAAGRAVRLRFAVRDTGIGIAPEACERIFDAFTQEDDGNTRRYGGAGLGLAICRQLVKLMGGLIGVESTPGRGSTFWFSLPLPVLAADDPRLADSQSPQPTAAGQALAAAAPLAGRVLMVEDNAVNRAVCAAMLEQLAIEYDEAYDGLEALEKAVDARFDLVLMDCQMPRLDGLEATRELRRRGVRARDGRPLPIVALTANAFDEDRERAIEAGMNGFLAKPVRLAELRESLASWLPPVADGADPDAALRDTA